MRLRIAFHLVPLVIGVVLSIAVDAGVPEQSVVGLNRAALRASPSVLAKAVEFLSYGTLVQVLESKGRWRKVQAQKATGWIEFSALGDKKSILKEVGKSQAEVSKKYQDEVASASKGFTAEMEEFQKKNNPQLNYAAVDQLEKITVQMQEVAEFAKQGQLHSRILAEEQGQ